MRRARSGVYLLAAAFCAGLVALLWTALADQLALERNLMVVRVGTPEVGALAHFEKLGETYLWAIGAASLLMLAFAALVLSRMLRRRRENQALRVSEQRFRLISEAIDEVFWLVDLTIGRIVYVSPGYEKIWGRSCASLLEEERSFLEVVHPEDRALVLANLEVRKKGRPFEQDYRIVHAGGAIRWVQSRGYPVTDADGRALWYVGVSQDITERKRVVQLEADRATKLKALSELSLSLSGDPSMIFERVVRMIGELFEVRVVCLSEIAGNELLFKAVCTNGKVLRDAGSYPLDNTPCATVLSTKDLRLYDRVAERFPQASFLRDHDAFAYCGFPSLDSSGQVIAVTCLLDDRPREFSAEDQHLLQLIGQRIATELERAKAISLRMKAEEALRHNEARLLSLFEYSPISVWEEDFSEVKARMDERRRSGVADFRAYFDEHGEEVARWAGLVKVVDVNQTSVEFFQADSKEAVSRNLPYYFTDESLAVFKEELVALAEGRTRFESEILIRTPRSGMKRLFLSLVVVPGNEDSLSRVLVSFMDITEPKRAEERLRASEAGMREAQQLAKVGSWELDVVTNDLHWSDEIFRIFEIDKSRFGASYDAFLDLVHSEDRDAVNKAYTNSLVERTPYEITHRLRMPDGRIKYVHERCETEFDVNGKPLRSIGTVQDVTERKAADNERAQLAAIVQNSNDALFSRTLEGEILTWNAGAERLYGYTAAEAVGKNLQVLLTPEDRWHESRANRELLGRGEPVAAYETVRRAKDGRSIHVLLSLAPILDSAGAVAAVAVVTHDITERKQAEDRIREALAEKEVLLQEIYHRVKNNLQVVASLLNMQGRATGDGRVKEMLRESADRVKSMALVHEQLYRSQDLSNISLTEYLEKLIEHLMAAHRPLSSRVAVKLEAEELTLGIETAVPLGLIVNELVSNAYKHGYGPDAARGRIVLGVRRLEGGRVRLEVADDGRGLPEGFEPKDPGSLGLQLVLTLTQQLGGELRCATAAGCTSFEVVFRPDNKEHERKVA